MCHFISWIETDKGIFYLTDKDIASKRGAELKEYCKNGSDLVGHGAIEYFYGIKGKHKEVTDFIIDKDKIPKEIQEAIKQGKFALMYRELSLLTPKALAEYEKIEKPAWAEYAKIEKPALAKYEKKCGLAYYALIKDPKNRIKEWR